MILTATLAGPFVSLPALRRHVAEAAEVGLDAVFFRRSPPGCDPLVVIAALAAFSPAIGLGGGVPIDFSEPFHVARAFAAIDRLTAGRSALVVEANETLAAACGNMVLPAERQARRREFFDVLGKLWDSWEDAALLVDRAAGLFTDPDRIHRIHHDGAYYAVRGPLNAPRPLQGAPVIVAPAGIDPCLAATVADVVLIDGSDESRLQARCAALFKNLAAQERDRNSIRVLADVVPEPGVFERGAGPCDGFNFALPAEGGSLGFLGGSGTARGGTLRERLGLRRRPSRFAA